MLDPELTKFLPFNFQSLNVSSVAMATVVFCFCLFANCAKSTQRIILKKTDGFAGNLRSNYIAAKTFSNIQIGKRYLSKS